jgi:ABC-type glycerol-3-phosphate transport system permease component
MAKPTKATRTVAHVAVGAAAGYVVSKVLGKGLEAVLIGALLAVLAHEMLDVPVARLMAANGIQF